MKRIVGAAAASDAAAVAAINIQHKTSTFQTPFSFCTFYAVRMKVFYHFFAVAAVEWVSVRVCVYWLHTQCAHLFQIIRTEKPVGRKEEIRSLAILTLPSQPLYCDGIVKNCNMIQGIDAYEKCSYIWYN